VGRAVRQALIDNEGVHEERVAVIYNGIDTPSSIEAVPNRDHVRAGIGVGKDDLLMLQVARLDPVKDHATALRTLERVVRHRPDTRLVLVGEGPERARIEELVKERRLTPYVRLLGLRNDVPRLLRVADLFLLTSVSEGIPLAILEALAAGLPVVATDVGGVRDLVEEGITGLLAPAGDDALLADRVLRLTKNPALVRQMGQHGRERALECFSESRMHAHYAWLYQEMLR
jgi:glycosyltransferase involved in cell wall biosynthesis